MRDNAVVHYHLRHAEPQAFHFDVDGVVGNLVSPELAPTRIKVRDLRRTPLIADFDSDGIIFDKHVSRIKDFNGSTDWQAIYNNELSSMLSNRIGAKEVVVFDHTLRIDHADAERKPARNVHNDYSPSGAKQRLVDILGEERARGFRAGHYGFVNVWRPVERPIRTSPLGFIRPGSVAAEDWIPIDLIYPHRRGQILGLAANENHDWFYLSNMAPDEVAIFNIFDNRGRPFLGHTALDIENSGPVNKPRKSIESRTLVRYR